MDCSTPGFPVLYSLPEFAQTHVHCVDAIQPSHPLVPSISPSSEYWGLISFRIDWFDLLVIQGTLRSLLQHHNSKASILQVLNLLYGPTLTSIYDYWKNHNCDWRHWLEGVIAWSRSVQNMYRRPWEWGYVCCSMQPQESQGVEWGSCLCSKSKGKLLICFRQWTQWCDEMCFLERSIWLQCRDWIRDVGRRWGVFLDGRCNFPEGMLLVVYSRVMLGRWEEGNDFEGWGCAWPWRHWFWDACKTLRR